MPIFHAIVLGLVQGFTEFLPVSSSGHLELVPWLFGWDDFDDESVQTTFDVALHLGTLIAVLGYFWSDVANYVREGSKVLVAPRRPMSADGRLAWLLLLATLPAAVIGAVFEDTIDQRLGTPVIIALSLIGFGILLAISDRAVGFRKLDRFGVRDAVIVGSAQALALNPGTSRSGITMSAARFLHFDRDAAVRMSFLMSLPVIAGAVLFKAIGATVEGIPDDLVVPMIVGVVTAALSGWVAVWGTIKIVQTHSLMPFVWYRIALGVFILLLLATGLR